MHGRAAAGQELQGWLLWGAEVSWAAPRFLGPRRCLLLEAHATQGSWASLSIKRSVQAWSLAIPSCSLGAYGFYLLFLESAALLIQMFLLLRTLQHYWLVWLTVLSSVEVILGKYRCKRTGRRGRAERERMKKFVCMNRAEQYSRAELGRRMRSSNGGEKEGEVRKKSVWSKRMVWSEGERSWHCKGRQQSSRQAVSDFQLAPVRGMDFCISVLKIRDLMGTFCLCKKEMSLVWCL